MAFLKCCWRALNRQERILAKRRYDCLGKKSNDVTITEEADVDRLMSRTIRNWQIMLSRQSATWPMLQPTSQGQPPVPLALLRACAEPGNAKGLPEGWPKCLLCLARQTGQIRALGWDHFHALNGRSHKNHLRFQRRPSASRSEADHSEDLSIGSNSAIADVASLGKLGLQWSKLPTSESPIAIPPVAPAAAQSRPITWWQGVRPRRPVAYSVTALQRCSLNLQRRRITVRGEHQWHSSPTSSGTAQAAKAITLLATSTYTATTSIGAANDAAITSTFTYRRFTRRSSTLTSSSSATHFVVVTCDS